MMLHKANHQDAWPDVELVDGIKAKELIPPVPYPDGAMSSHKIWIPPHTFYPPHTHPAPHMILILDGAGRGHVGPADGGIHFSLNAGDVFYVPGNTRHVVGSDHTGMVMLAVSVGSLALTDPRRLVPTE